MEWMKTIQVWQNTVRDQLVQDTPPTIPDRLPGDGSQQRVCLGIMLASAVLLAVAGISLLARCAG